MIPWKLEIKYIILTSVHHFKQSALFWKRLMLFLVHNWPLIKLTRVSTTSNLRHPGLNIIQPFQNGAESHVLSLGRSIRTAYTTNKTHNYNFYIWMLALIKFLKTTTDLSWIWIYCLIDIILSFRRQFLYAIKSNVYYW